MLWVPGIPYGTGAVFESACVVGAGRVGRAVAARLDELPPKQRMALELRVFHELTFAEIADVAGCSEDSAKANYHHALKRIRNLLPGGGGDEDS